MIHMLWKEVDLKRQGREGHPDVNALLVTQCCGDVYARAAAKGHGLICGPGTASGTLY